MQIKCKQCGQRFELNDSELEYYKTRKLSFPERCKSCRTENKMNNVVGSVYNDGKSGKKITGPSLVLVIILGIVLAFAVYKGVVSLEDFNSTKEPIPTTPEEYAQQAAEEQEEALSKTYTFADDKKKQEHYEKHGIDMGFASADEYEAAASAVVTNPNALHKLEAEDGDDVYYIEDTNEFVVVSTSGYIRTYFNPDRGIDYYNSQ